VKSGLPSGVRGAGPVGAERGRGVAKFVVFCACTQAVATRAAPASAQAKVVLFRMYFLI